MLSGRYPCKGTGALHADPLLSLPVMRVAWGFVLAAAAGAPYIARSLTSRAQGPYLARWESMPVKGHYLSKTVATDPDAAKTIYVSDVDFPKSGKYVVLGVFRLDNRLVGAGTRVG